MFKTTNNESQKNLEKPTSNRSHSEGQAKTEPHSNPSLQTIFRLQRTLGNHAVGRILKAGGLNLKSPKGKHNGDFSERKESKPRDKDSRDERFSQTDTLQFALSDEDPSTNPSPHIPRGGGTLLPQSVRQQMSQSLGADFSDVRVHDDSAANKAAMDFGAKAFTHGRDIYFAKKQYNPTSARGKGLIAHELTHVMQQKAGQHHSSGATGTYQQLERQAENAEHTVQREEATKSEEIIPSRADIQCNISETLAAIRAAASGGVEAIANWIIGNLAATNATIARLAGLRTALRRLSRPLIFQPSEITLMSRLYQSFVQLAPTWMPVPRMDFTPVVQRNPIIVVGGIVLGATELLLLALIFILLIWLLLRANPDIREAQDQAVREAVEAMERAMRRPRPEPEPEPEPRPLGPDIFPPIPEPEPRRRRRDLPYRWQTPHNYQGRNGRLTYSGATRPGVNYNSHGHHVWPLVLGGPSSQTLMTVIETIHLEEMHYGRSPVGSPVVATAGSIYNYLTNYLNNDPTFGPSGINVLQGRRLTHTGGSTSGNVLLVTRMGQGDTTARRLAGAVRTALTDYYTLFKALSNPTVPRNAFRQGLDDSYNHII